jgi:hypothetical protein
MLEILNNIYSLHHQKGWIPSLMADMKTRSLLRPLIDYSPSGRESRLPDSVMLEIAKKFLWFTLSESLESPAHGRGKNWSSFRH